MTGDAHARLREKIALALAHAQIGSFDRFAQADAVLDALTDGDLADLLGLERREYCGICTVDLSSHPTPICKGKPGSWHWVGPWQPVDPT